MMSLEDSIYLLRERGKKVENRTKTGGNRPFLQSLRLVIEDETERGKRDVIQGKDSNAQICHEGGRFNELYLLQGEGGNG